MKHLFLHAMLALTLCTMAGLPVASGQTKAPAKKTTAKKTPAAASANAWAGSVKTRHIFFQDYWVYYDKKKKVFWWFNNGKWLSSSSVPESLRRADLKSARKAPIDMETDTPWNSFPAHKAEFPKKQ